MAFIHYDKVFIQPIASFPMKEAQLDVLRLDQIHPIVSGNKWFKLQLQLKQALQKKHTIIATFGGAYSNHIIATAFAGKELGLKTIGIIRGEAPIYFSDTLQAAEAYGMELKFVSRDAYKDKQAIQKLVQHPNTYWIQEGGYSVAGAVGIQEIYQWIDASYTHIICAVGTGTMMAGLIKGAMPHQQIIGISALKGYPSLLQQVMQLLTEEERKKSFHLINDYHFGGYAKHTKQLIDWMLQLHQQEHLPTDKVYTAKMMYGVFDLALQHYFPPKSKILAIHSGGMQGNQLVTALSSLT